MWRGVTFIALPRRYRRASEPASVWARPIVTDGTVACHNLVRRRAKIGPWHGSCCRHSRSRTAAASVAVALDRVADAPTTYAATAGALAAADLVAGLGLIAAGVLIWAERPRSSAGPLATLLGVVWLAPDWVGWEAGPALVRSVAMLAAPLLLAVLVHLVLAFPAGRIATGGARVAVAVRLRCRRGRQRRAGARARSVPRPRLLEQLHGQRLPRPLRPAAGTLDRRPLAVALGRRRRAARGLRLPAPLVGQRPGRAALWPVLVPAALAALAQAAYAIALLRDPRRGPGGAPSSTRCSSRARRRSPGWPAASPGRSCATGARARPSHGSRPTSARRPSPER